MHVSIKRFGLVLVVAILTITGVATLVHRHTGGDDPGCVLCHVRQERAISNPVVITIGNPLREERRLEIVSIRLVTRQTASTQFGRAPPSQI